ncbi:Fujikurins efflux protein [Lachnellula suecica]|uniref:Fujikurins efflux protein n=1 Tax=Lachnellula suecica TaxID=602035 RepID=A0A8T9BWU6_9HELO|nr:Fujikurins efflux protein [Lachnellula suecica]
MTSNTSPASSLSYVSKQESLNERFSQDRAINIESINLQAVAQAGHDVEIVTVREVNSEAGLPPADGGKDAWLFLAGCFVFEALVWGFPFSFGVFQEYYTTHLPFSGSPNGIAAVGTCATGVMYLFAPVSLYILEVYPSIRRLSSIFGLVIAIIALISSSFATKVWHLILTQGILYAIGGSFLYAPTMFYLDDWFIKRKGLAFGIMWAGVGTAGVVFPFLLTAMLDHLGFATTLRLWSLFLFVLCTPSYITSKHDSPFLRHLQRGNRYPYPISEPAPYSSFTNSPSLRLSNILESLGFFLPSIYLPSYSQSLGLSSTSGTLLLSLLNAFSVLGAIGFGGLCDRLHVTTVIAISSIGSTLSVFIFWGLGTHLPLLIVFAATYGFFAGGFSAIWSGMMKEAQKASPGAGMGSLMGLFAAGRGIGSVVSGPLSEVMLKGGFRGRVGAYTTEYAVLVVFTGVSAAAGLVAFGAGRSGSSGVTAGETADESE